jgi:AcrR family transcriptional regulator
MAVDERIVQPGSLRNGGGRQAAYTARNRAALIAAAQRVLVDFGPDATVEQLVAAAKVSPTTIYNYFDNKDALLREALNQMWQEWVAGAYGLKQPGETFADMIDVCRKLFRLGTSHPAFAQVLSKTLDSPSFVIAAVRSGALPTLEHVAGPGGLDTSDFDKRLDLWSYALVGILHGVYVTHALTPAEADQSLAISLSIWNLSSAKASKLTTRPLTQ